MRAFYITGISPDNRHEYHYIVAENKEEAVKTFGIEYPELAIVKIQAIPAKDSSEIIKRYQR